MFGETCREGQFLNEGREFVLRHLNMLRDLEYGEGIHLVDSAGRRYTDFLSQYGAVSFGHSPRFVWEAIERMGANNKPCLVQPFLAPTAKTLARKLLEKTRLDFRHVVLCNSGAETIEAALKMARAATGRDRIISSTRGFHGKTHAAVLVTGNTSYREPFRIRSEDFVKVHPENLEELEQTVMQVPAAALVLEPVIGEGGMVALSDRYLLGAQKICRKHGVLLILDEIQTGLHRTGPFLASHQVTGLSPDILCLSKALGGGVVPIGAVLAKEGAWTEEFGLLHSSTFANNQLSCSAALAVLDYLDQHGDELQRHVECISASLSRRLTSLVDRFGDVFQGHSGVGLMRALQVRRINGSDSYFIAHACSGGNFIPLLCGYLFHNFGLIVAPLFSAPDAIRIEPPLIVQEDHLDQLIAGLEQCGTMIRERRFSSLLSYLLERSPDELGYSETCPRPSATLAPEEAVISSGETRLGSFSFLIHPPHDEDLMSIMPESIESLVEPHRSEMLGWMESWFQRRHDAQPVFHARRIASKAGGYVEGWLIASPLTSRQMLRLPRAERKRLLDGYVEQSRKLGVDIMGLGAFTSVISRGGSDIDRSLVNVTTGNSLTAIAVAESLLQGLEWMNGSLNGLSAAIVGAAGSVGRLAAIHLSEKVGRLVLVGNPTNPRSVEKLSYLIGELYAHGLIRLQQGLHTGLSGIFRKQGESLFTLLNACNRELLGSGTPDYFRIKQLVEGYLDVPPVVATTNVRAALRDAHGVVSATSRGAAFIEPSWLRPNAVVADAARPADLQEGVRGARPDVLAFEGGLVRLPHPYEFGRANVLGFHKDINLGCLCETIVLAMSGAKRSYSIGDRIPYEESFLVNRLAQLHGFRPCIALASGEIELESRQWAAAEGG